MKRFGLALLGLLVLGWTADAQTSREELLSHMELTAGNYANYPLPTGHLTPAPAGMNLSTSAITAAMGRGT